MLFLFCSVPFHFILFCAFLFYLLTFSSAGLHPVLPCLTQAPRPRKGSSLPAASRPAASMRRPPRRWKGPSGSAETFCMCRGLSSGASCASTLLYSLLYSTLLYFLLSTLDSFPAPFCDSTLFLWNVRRQRSWEFQSTIGARSKPHMDSWTVLD